MKKRYLLLAALLLIPFGVKAEGIAIECDKTTATPNSEVHCAIVGYGEEIGAVKGQVVVTNGTVTKVEKNVCGFGEATETEVSCVDIYQPTSMKAATYTIKVGGSGTTTIGLTSAEYALGNGSSFENVNVTPVNITIGTSANDPTPTPAPVVIPEPTDTTEPEKQEQKTPSNTTTTEQKNTGKEKIKNPETGAFLNITLVLVALGFASYISYKVVKKQKFFRL
jgi:hypothetical protein